MAGRGGWPAQSRAGRLLCENLDVALLNHIDVSGGSEDGAAVHGHQPHSSHLLTTMGGGLTPACWGWGRTRRHVVERRQSRTPRASFRCSAPSTLVVCFPHLLCRAAIGCPTYAAEIMSMMFVVGGRGRSCIWLAALSTTQEGGAGRRG